ncbi:MAG: heme/hemin ABC transporter substrate-binding protein [Microcella sp.]
MPFTVRRPAVRALAAVSALLVLAGCTAPGDPGSNAPGAVGERPPLADIALLDDPRTQGGPATARIADAAIEPVLEAPASTLPTTVVSRDLDGDRDIEVQSAERVLALDIAGSIAATTWALGFGDRLIGRDVSTTFPGTDDLPLVTSSGHAVSAESVLSLRPDLIITDGTVGPTDVLVQLRSAGITVVYVDVDPGLAAPAELARDVAAIFGAPEAGELLAERLDAELDAVLTQIAAVAPSAPGERVRILFLYLRGASGIYYLFGEESGADELIEGLGGVDVAGEIGWTGLRPMTDEALIAADPDLILVMSSGLSSVGGVDGLLAEKPAIALTSAGQNRRFVDMADGEVLSFGPRTPLVLDALARAIYGVDD